MKAIYLAITAAAAALLLSACQRNRRLSFRRGGDSGYIRRDAA